MDQQTHISYWVASALEDMSAVEALLTKRHWRHGLFFAHLALEKLLKAHVVKKTGSHAPKTHNLLYLLSLTGLSAPAEITNVLANYQQFNLEGRYPDSALPAIAAQDAEFRFREAQEVTEWLRNKL